MPRSCLVSFLVCLALFASAGEAQRLAGAASAYSAGEYAACASRSLGLENGRLLNKDTALFLRGQCRFYAGDYQKARRCFLRLARRFPDSPHAVLSLYRAADCSRELGRSRQAAREYQRAAGEESDPRVDPAVGLYHRAVQAMTDGPRAKGQKLWIRLRIEHPAHPLAGALPAQLPEPSLSFDESLALARSLHRARRWEEALAVLDSIPEPLDRRQGYRLAYRAGRILFDMRDRYRQAAGMLLAAKNHAASDREAEDAWFYYSRALGRLDQDDQAIASHLAMVKRHPRGKHAARAHFYAGWLEQNQDRCDQAVGILEEVLERYPGDRWAREARWTLAWCHLRHRRWQAAVAALAPQHGQGHPEVGGRALYWTAMAQASRGNRKQARALWRKTIRRFPLTWYSLLARLRLGSAAPPPPRPPGNKPVPRLESPLLDRARELIGAGLQGFASVLLQHGEKEFLATHRKPSGLECLLDTYRKAGDYHRPWKLIFRHRPGSLRRLPSRMTRWVWEHSYPACARDLLERHAGQVPGLTLFLQAIMRTESGFDPLALSVANARGLLQLYPPIARKVAGAMGIAYSDDRLFDPEYNVRMAAWLIGHLLEKFRRQWPLAASAYNGGSPAMMEWCQENGKLELDAFVESIPWAESRRYAKRVTKAFARYRYLEGLPLPELSLRVNPDFLKDEYDF